jgi:hypothetical protein
VLNFKIIKGSALNLWNTQPFPFVWLTQPNIIRNMRMHRILERTQVLINFNEPAEEITTKSN